MAGDRAGDPSDSSTPASGIFPRTRWSMVLEAKGAAGGAGGPALDEWCRVYWRPVYLFVRSRGHGRADAEDLTQEFFFRLLRGDYLRAVEGPERGRLRSFLSVVLRRFLADERGRRATRKRGGDWKPIPIDADGLESRLAVELGHGFTADMVFDRQWALDLLDQATWRLRADYREAGREDLFDSLKPWLALAPESTGYAEVAESLGMTAGAVKVAVHRLRQRFRECLEGCLHDTLADGGDVDEELAYLRSVFVSLQGGPGDGGAG